MSEITGINRALQGIQSTIQTEIGIQVIRQAAKADQALADILADSLKAAAEASQSQPATKGISIYV